MHEKIFEKFFGNPSSILVLLAGMGILSLPFVPNDGNWTLFIIFWLFALIIFVSYTIYVVENNSIPHCRRREIGVLFILRVASDEQFEEFKFTIEQNFMNSLQGVSSSIAPVFVNAFKLKKYDIKNPQNMRQILNKANCYFCIEVFIETDSQQQTQKYLATVNYGVLHPNISKTFNEKFQQALSDKIKLVGRIEFTTSHKIEAIKHTTNYFSTLSQYVISVLLLICHKNDEAVVMLEALYTKTENRSDFYQLICEALYVAATAVASQILDAHLETNEIGLLEKAEHYYTLANQALPNQFGYHLDMATLIFLKERNVSKVKEHLAYCKEINESDIWEYSDAFIYAYEYGNPNVVYQKYAALEHNSYNSIEIIAFIEKVLEEEPQKNILHLALGLLYDHAGDATLASCHLKQFVVKYDGKYKLRKKAAHTIRGKIQERVCVVSSNQEYCANCMCSQSAV